MAGYTWPNGTRNHTISWATHLQHVNAKSAPAFQAGKTGLGAGLQPIARGAPTKGVSRPLTPVPGAGAGLQPQAPTIKGAPAAPPPNPALEQAVGAINATRDSTIAGLEGQKTQALSDYGYKVSGYDTTGKPLGLTFDASNPYSRASLLLRNYNQQRAGTTNTMAGQGQLHSGAYRHLQASQQFNYNASNNALITALTQLLVGYAGGEQSARNKANTDIAAANGQYLPTS